MVNRIPFDEQLRRRNHRRSLLIHKNIAGRATEADRAELARLNLADEHVDPPRRKFLARMADLGSTLRNAHDSLEPKLREK